jgi:hypothetical protein
LNLDFGIWKRRIFSPEECSRGGALCHHAAGLDVWRTGILMTARLVLPRSLMKATVFIIGQVPPPGGRLQALNAALPLLLAASILERRLFFQSVHAPRMPGNFGPRAMHS